MKIGYYIGFILLTLFGLSIVSWTVTLPSNDEFTFETQLAQKDVPSNTGITVDASVQSKDHQGLYAGSDGMITEVSVRPGEDVKKGQVLAKLDQESVQEGLYSKLSNLENSLGTSFNPESELQQIRSKRKSGFFSAADANQAQSELLKQVRDYADFLTSLTQLKKETNGKIIRAPFDGTVASVGWIQGEFVQQNRQETAGISVIRKNPSFEFRLEIPQEFIHLIRKGQHVVAHLPLTNLESMEAEVVSVSSSITKSADDQRFIYYYYVVEAKPLLNSKSLKQLRVGQRIRADITLDQDPNIVWIPTSAFEINLPERMIDDYQSFLPKKGPPSNTTETTHKEMLNATPETVLNPRTNPSMDKASNDSTPYASRVSYIYILNDAHKIIKTTVLKEEERSGYIGVRVDQLDKKRIVTHAHLKNKAAIEQTMTQ